MDIADMYYEIVLDIEESLCLKSATDSIEIKVISKAGQAVSIAIDAPRHIMILRKELINE